MGIATILLIRCPGTDSAMNASGDSSEVDELSHGPFDCFRQPDVLTKLRSHPHTRQYMTDSGFIQSVEFLRTAKTQQETRTYMEDPRVMQAMAALQGWGLSVTSEDLGKAEWLGQMPKRDAVQYPNLERAVVHKTIETAKEGGNAHFKEGTYSDALACWLRAFHLHEHEHLELDQSTKTTLHSNCAAALLKLKRPSDALDSCELALQAAPEGTDVSKVHFRISQAHEELSRGVGVTVEQCAGEWGKALEGMRAALTAAKAAAESGSKAANVRHMQKELARVKAAATAARAKAKEAQEQAVRDAQAETLRTAGKALPGNDKELALIRKPAPGYVRDIDLSHWAAAWLQREVGQLRHCTETCIIEVTGLNTQVTYSRRRP